MASLIKEVVSAHQFFSLKSIEDPGYNQMAKNFAKGLIQQINSCLTLSLHDATALMHALKESPYDDADLKRIEKTIDAKVMMLKPSKLATVKDQLLRNLGQDWCTQDDHVMFDDPHKPWHSKACRLVERGNSVGCSHPSEETLRWMLAFLLMKHYREIPNATEIHHKVHELKQVVLCERKTFPYEQLLVFPSNPVELPEHIWSYAYGDGEPISVTMLGIKTVAEKSVAMRSNAKILRKAAEPSARADRIKQEQEATQHFATGSVPLKLEADGSLTVPSPGHSLLKPKNDGVANSKAENNPSHSLLRRKNADCMRLDDDFANSQADDSDAPSLKNEDEDTTNDSKVKKAMELDDSSSELDPYAQASLEAMRLRNTRKKQENADKKKAEALLKRPAGLKHDVLKKPAGLKHDLLGKPKVEKKCITKPSKSIDKPKCTHSKTPKILPSGWKNDKKIYDDGRSTKIYVSPGGKRFDRWSHVQAHVKANR